MTSRDDEHFDIRPGKPRGKGSDRFVQQVLQAAGRKLGGRSAKRPGTGPRARGRGHVAAALQARQLGRTARRVVVKVRLVVLRNKLVSATTRHLRYLARLGPDESTGIAAYDAVHERADTAAFAERMSGDRHQFRMILAPEDGVALGELKPFTRAFMAQMERDLGTRLEWVAVDHSDTDNPHSHIVMRGRAQDGTDLVISRDYISVGMRTRAQELATAWLGPRSEQEIRASQIKELTADRWTGLDRALDRDAVNGVLDLRESGGVITSLEGRALRLGRLAHWARLGLATEERPYVWHLAPKAEAVLRELGERGDIIRTVQRALGKDGSNFAIYDPRRSLPITGRLVTMGWSDELNERAYLVIQPAAGPALYVPRVRVGDIGRVRIGDLVSISSAGLTRGPRAIAYTPIGLAR